MMLAVGCFCKGWATNVTRVEKKMGKNKGTPESLFDSILQTSS